jgi:zinc transporter 1/2/3
LAGFQGRSLPIRTPDAAEDCAANEVEDYDLGLAIASVFVIFAASLLGASLPCVLSLTENWTVVFGLKLLAYCGGGVLLTTGFIHLLLPAQENLSSPCLSEGWLSAYPSWAFLFCVIAIAVMQMVDYYVATWIMRYQKRADAEVPSDPSPSKDNFLDTVDICVTYPPSKDMECGECALVVNQKVRFAAVVISEASVAVHSLLIGLALGVTNRTNYVALFIALIFHQLLEGVGLGSAAVHAGMRTRLVLVLAVVFSLTTPLGTAIGIGLRQSLNMNGPAALYAMGTLDALCAGMLISLALGDHINAIRSQAGWLREQSAFISFSCMAAFGVGVAAMMVIGIWA